MNTNNQLNRKLILINQIAHTYTHCKTYQGILNDVDLGWSSIYNFYLLETEERAGPYFGKFYKVLFDWNDKTTDFPYNYSIN